MKHLFRVFIFLCFFAVPGTVAAQNLVPNPSFENYSSCPTYYSQISFATSWSMPTGGTSDYFNACSTTPLVDVPSNYFGNQAAHSGNAYAGFYLYIPTYPYGLYREYIQAPLLSPLVAGQTYKVSFYVSLAEESHFAIDGIGAYFSNGPVAQGGYAVLTVTPQVSNLSGNIISDKVGWTLVQGNFVASGGESHIVIGNFKDDANTNFIVVGDPYAAYAYYYIDDVSVEPGVDLSIQKAAVTTPGPMNPNYNFQLTVKNLGAAFNGNNFITVADTAPAGLAFTGVTATVASDWTCSFTASLVSCLYIGTGPSASNQTIGTISIAATATTFPLPLFAVNCATVALAAASGHVDANVANNKACATLPNLQHCEPPMVPGSVPGQCICPPGTVQQGPKCVTICPPPKVPGPILGVCVCPPGTVQLPNGNCVSPAQQGRLKVCKVAGPFVPVGTPFSFQAGTSPPFTVLAGPAPGGTCSLGPTFNVGSTVSVTETVPSGTIVSAITVAPPPRLVGLPNLAAGTVQVMIGSGVTDVTFTNRRQAGYLEICKRTIPALAGAGSFSFSVNPGNLGPFVVPAQSCSPAIEVAAGTVTITELPSLGTQLVGCSTLPATQQGPCNVAARTSTVTVAPGDVSTQTIAIFMNSFFHFEQTVDDEKRQ